MTVKHYTVTLKHYTYATKVKAPEYRDWQYSTLCGEGCKREGNALTLSAVTCPVCRMIWGLHGQGSPTGWEKEWAGEKDEKR